jgi:hypothetical protein
MVMLRRGVRAAGEQRQRETPQEATGGKSRESLAISNLTRSMTSSKERFLAVP